MADASVTLNAGSGGASLATYTDTGSIDHQRVVLEIQSSGDPVHVNASHPLPVDGSGVTQPVSASALPLPTGAATAAKQPAIGTAGTASSDVISVQGVASMTALKVDGSGVTQPVSGTFWQTTQPVSAASLPLPTGAATAAKQPAVGTAGTASSDVLSVQGVASMTALKVDPSAVTSPVSLASLPALASGSNTIGSIKLTDGTSTATIKSLTDAKALNVAIVDGNGDQITSFGGSGGTSLTDAATFTRGTTSETPVGGIAETSNPTLTTGKAAALSLDTSGNLRTTVSNGVSSGTAGSPSANVVSVQGITSGTVLGVQDTPQTSGGLSRNYQIAPATPAKTVVKSSAGQLYAIKASNNNASPRYVKLWDNATGSVTLGTTACDDQFEIPGNTAGAGFVYNIDKGIAFATGIIAAVTGAIASADNTSISANEVILTLYYK